MPIQYVAPLSRGWGRMKRALFQPFDFKKWLIVAFTAFLAQLSDFGGGGGGGGKWGRHGGEDFGQIMELPRRAWDWLQGHPAWFGLIVFGVIVIAALLVLATWLSARGKFMFLDNVVHDRARVAAPWAAFRAEGNSLFLWKLVFILVAFSIVAGVMIEAFFRFHDLYEAEGYSALLLAPIVIRLLILGIIFLLVGLVDLYLSSFVVPIMYRERIGTMAAWSRFLNLLGKNVAEFILFALFFLALLVAVVIVLVVFGFVTCCCGFVILALPYVRDVLLLPLWYTGRAFSVEFLEQFGPEYRLFPTPEAPPPPPDSPPSFNDLVPR